MSTHSFDNHSSEKPDFPTEGNDAEDEKVDLHDTSEIRRDDPSMRLSEDFPGDDSFGMATAEIQQYLREKGIVEESEEEEEKEEEIKKMKFVNFILWAHVNMEIHVYILTKIAILKKKKKKKKL